MLYSRRVFEVRFLDTMKTIGICIMERCLLHSDGYHHLIWKTFNHCYGILRMLPTKPSRCRKRWRQIRCHISKRYYVDFLFVGACIVSIFDDLNRASHAFLSWIPWKTRAISEILECILRQRTMTVLSFFLIRAGSFSSSLSHQFSYWIPCHMRANHVWVNESCSPFPNLKMSSSAQRRRHSI